MADSFQIAAPSGPLEMFRSTAAADPVDWLPPSAATRLTNSLQAEADARAALLPREQFDELRQAKAAAEARLRHLREIKTDRGAKLADDHVSIVTEQRRLDKVVAELARLSEIDSKRFAVFNTASRIAQRAVAWCRNDDLSRPTGTTISAVEPPAVVLLKSETPAAAIARHRLRLNELNSEAHRTRSLTTTRAEAKAAMRESVGAFSARGAPDVTMLIETGGPIDWPSERRQMDVIATSADFRAFAIDERIATHALLIWLHKDVMIKKLDAEIDALADDSAAISATDRAEKLAAIAEERLQVERTEVAVIEAAAQDGITIPHREDVDVRALLAVELVADVRAPISGTSGGHVIDVIEGRRR